MSYEEPLEVTNNFTIRDHEYSVTVVPRNKQLIIEVEDADTTDQWRGEFDAKFVEDLTHKTGNFKQFPIFSKMLESAVKRDSDSVSVDVLTFADLEMLRGQKISGSAKKANSKSSSSNGLKTKRYLILTYTVEFDRIHYPLPLIHVGKPDVHALQTLISQLRQEVKFLKTRLRKMVEGTNMESLESGYEKLLAERDRLASDLSSCQQELKSVSKGVIAKELKILKQVVQSLETDLMKERTKYQRMLGKKSQEIKTLSVELDDTRASERNLKARCRNLTEELGILKRGVSPSLRSSNRYSASRPPARTHVTRGRSASRTPSPITQRFDPTSYIQEKQRKLQEAALSRRRKNSRDGSYVAPRSRSVSLERRHTPNSSSIAKPPTRKTGPRSAARCTSQHRGQRVSSACSVSSVGSLMSSNDSDSDAGSFRATKRRRDINASRENVRSNQKATKTKQALRIPSESDCSDQENRSDNRRDRKSSQQSNSRRNNTARRNQKQSKQHNDTLSKKRIPLGTKKNSNGKTDDSFDRAYGISEIDARLDALQKFMKANMK